jgi:O-antigen chain-terminating methyltransferase
LTEALHRRGGGGIKESKCSKLGASKQLEAPSFFWVAKRFTMVSTADEAMPNESEDLAKLHGRLQELKVNCARIGQPPAYPPTLRGKLGARLVSVVRRMLFWYTPPLQATLQGLTQVIDDLLRTAGRMQEAMDQLEQRLQAQVLERERLRGEEWKEWFRHEGAQKENLDYTQELSIRLKAQEEGLQQERLRGDRLEEGLRQEQLHHKELDNRLREQGETLLRECLRSDELEKSLRQEYLYREGLESRLNAREDYLQLLHTQKETIEQERRRMTEMMQQERLCTIELEGRLREQVDGVQQLQEEQQSQEYINRLQKAEERVQILRRELMEQTRRISRLLEETRKRLPEPLDPEQVEVFEQEGAHDLDSLYVAFEDALRGPREEIQARLKVYLPLLEKEFTVLDVGCGRGEWLDLLRQEGYRARGVDFNRIMVEECREKQLDVEGADALDYLRRVPDASVGAVTVFHMVEHLPFRKLVLLLDEVTRILQPGGIAIFETPNPNNFLVGSRNFYFDPTHRNPIPNETLRFLVESRGLCQVKVMPLNACDPCNHVPEGKEGGALVRRFNEYFYGPQDYAVIGRKV